MKYLLKAKIYPDGLAMTTATPMVLRLTQVDFGIDGELAVTFNGSDLDIQYETERKYSPENTSEIETLKNFIEDVVRIPVDAFGFVKSVGFDLCILNFEPESKAFSHQFIPRGEYSFTKDNKTAGEETLDILNKISIPKNISLIEILGDFRMGIKYPKMTASFCYRAIEIIRKKFFENDWLKLRQKMNLKEEDFAEILKFGVPNRHGEYPVISGTQRERIMNFTRQIIENLIKSL